MSKQGSNSELHVMSKIVVLLVLYFRYLNVSAVSLANNHILDYGEEAVNTTMRILKSNNILYSGVTFSSNKKARQVDITFYVPGWTWLSEIQTFKLFMLFYLKIFLFYELYLCLLLIHNISLITHW